MLIRECANLIVNNLSLKTSQTEFVGGGFFIEKIYGNFSNIISFWTTADSEGFMMISGISSKIILENVTMKNSSSKLDGGALKSINIELLRLIDFNSENCTTFEGMGIITLTGFSSLD